MGYRPPICIFFWYVYNIGKDKLRYIECLIEDWDINVGLEKFLEKDLDESFFRKVVENESNRIKIEN